MSCVRGHEMSAKQLDELWRYENTLAHHLLDMPLRKCTAAPSGQWGKEMDSEEFLKLKGDVRKMWCRASLIFMAYKCDGDAGWGLRVRNDLGKKLSLTENSFTVLGWLVKAPSPTQCLTGHRYLRSPAFEDLYLGGPISLANFSNSPSLKCWRSVSNGPSQFCVYVRTLKPIDGDAELTWIYDLHLGSRTKNLFSIKDWQLGCCMDPEKPASTLASTPEFSSKVSLLHRPTKRKKLMKSYMWCTYCGVNLDDNACRVNRKEHWALHHSVQLCNEFHAVEDETDPKNGVNPKAFKYHLEVVDSVLRSLKDYNYTVLPACHFFSNESMETPLDEDENGKMLCLEKFQQEAKEAFRKYKVVYLCGIRFPVSFSELLPVPETTYKDVVWLNNLKPRSNQFAILKSLSPDEKDSLALDIKTEFEHICCTFVNET